MQNPKERNHWLLGGQGNVACRHLEAHAIGKRFCNDLVNEEGSDSPPNKVNKTGMQASGSNLRHVATEKKRRERINEGCVSALLAFLISMRLHWQVHAMQLIPWV